MNQSAKNPVLVEIVLVKGSLPRYIRHCKKERNEEERRAKRRVGKVRAGTRPPPTARQFQRERERERGGRCQGLDLHLQPARRLRGVA